MRFLVLKVNEITMQYHKIKLIARKLRKNQTPAEKTLWPYLRERRLMGRRFMRQHPIIYDSKRNEHFFFVADFYCREENLVIELDGPVHIVANVICDIHRDVDCTSTITTEVR